MNHLSWQQIVDDDEPMDLVVLNLMTGDSNYRIRLPHVKYSQLDRLLLDFAEMKIAAKATSPDYGDLQANRIWNRMN